MQYPYICQWPTQFINLRIFQKAPTQYDKHCYKHYHKWERQKILDAEIQKAYEDGEENVKTTRCSKPKCGLLFKSYKTSTGKDASWCRPCYELQCAIEDNRGKRERNWSQEEKNNLERMEKKQQYRADHPEQVTAYSIISRNKSIQKDPVEYRQRNAEHAKNRRAFYHSIY